MTIGPLVTGFALGPTVEVIEKHAGWRAVERAFAAAAVPLSVIEERRLFIPYAGEAALIEHAARAAGEANLGVLIGREFPFKDLGVYGRYVTMAPNLTAALERALRGVRYVTNSGVFGMDVDGRHARITYESGLRGLKGARHIHAGTLLLLVDLVRQFAGPAWAPIRIELDEPKGPDHAGIERLFGAPIAFSCKKAAIVFDVHCLKLPNRRPSTAHEQLTLRDLKQMVRERPRKDLRSAVEAVLRLRLLDGMTDIDGTSIALGVGPRSLQRRLHREGVTYRELVERVRLERAADLLTETATNVADVAGALGYSTSGHFIRAFTRWTGRTPGARRRAAL